jgi:hypothetical protein
MELASKAAMFFDRNTSSQWAIGAGHTRCSTPDRPHLAVLVAAQPNGDRRGIKRIHIKTVLYAEAARLSFTDFVRALQLEHRISTAAMQTKDEGYWSILRHARVTPQLARYLDRTGVELLFPKEYAPAEARACTSLAFAAASLALLQTEGRVSYV